MPLPPAYHESLPYIDTEPTPQELAAANALIAAEASSSPSTSSLPPSRQLNFSPAILTELDRVASSTPLQPFNETRYQVQELPTDAASSSIADLRAVLAKSYVSNAYLASRIDNLSLLDRHGRNAWLLSNYHIEADLRAIERDLAAAKMDIDTVNAARAAAQNHVKGEILALDDNWKKGVTRVLETELAVEELKIQIREELRNRGTQNAQQVS